MTSAVVPARSQHVVCAVGSELEFDRLAAVIAQVGGPGFALDRDYSQDQPDDRMVDAFSVSADRVVPSFGERDHAAVADHKSVAYILGPAAGAADAFAVSLRMLAVVGAIFDAGVDAVKTESSGIAHGRDRWLYLAGLAATVRGREGQAPVLYAAFVRRPLSTGLVYYSCGMHLLGEADVELTAADDDRGLEWMDGLARYLLVDRAGADVRDGDTFGLAESGIRRVLRHRPCVRHREDDLFFNPWGYWRLTTGN
jgi:hypothetical protein